MSINFLSRRRSWLIILLAFSFVFLLQSFACADPKELATIQKAIKGKKAHWVATETPFSQLSPEARKKRVEALKPLLREQEHEEAAEEQAALATVTPPANYDWSSHTVNTAPSFVTPVRDQGGCGSCWAFATTAALESQVLMENNAPGVDLNLSEQIMVSCSGAGSCGGGYINTSSDFLRQMGLPTETYFPYTATNNSCTSAPSDWTNNVYKINGWHWVATTSPTVASLKSALVTYGPLATMMSVYSDFGYYKAGVYSQVSGSFVGWHCILIVGYDDANQCFVVKNSWGANWGESGFFRIAYSQVGNAVSFGDYTVAYDGSPSVIGPQPDPQPLPPPPPPPPDPQPQPQPPCTFSLSPSGQTFKPAGGSGSILVSTQGTCAWTAVSNVDWIAFPPGVTVSGNGSGQVSFTVLANTGTQRSGTITAAGQTFTVTQQKARPSKR
jgi:C1A family cysteine protease